MISGYKPEGSLLASGKHRDYLGTLAGLERAMTDGVILEGVVTLCDADLRLHVDLGCAEGILEPNEAVYCRDGEVRKDIAVISRVGKPISFLILSMERAEGRMIAHLSRRLAQKRCVDAYRAHLRAGDLLEARVTHLEPFGAFLDIGCGVSSLLSVDCISVSRISHPRDRLSCGDRITVAVKSIDRESGRIYATLRELLGTWEQNAAAFSVGQTVTGIIRSVEEYGVFIELAPNLAGLAEPREEMGDLHAHVGRTAAVYIKSIVPDRMKVKLILIDVHCPTPPVKALPYFISLATTHHLDRWTYSPANARRLVETVFED